MFDNDTRVIAKDRRIFATGLRTPTLCNVSDMGTPTQPEEARVIDAAQKSAMPAVSMREAARRAGISDGRWRQIVKGYQGTGTGRIPVVGPDETIARMALAVGVTDSQLANAGRPEAAEVLRQLVAQSAQPDVELAEVSLDRLLGEIRRRVEGNDHEHRTEPHDPSTPQSGASGSTDKKTARPQEDEDGRSGKSRSTHNAESAARLAAATLAERRRVERDRERAEVKDGEGRRVEGE